MKKMLTSAIVLAMAMGCSAATDSTTSAVVVEKAQYTEDVMYIDLSISDRPMTAEEIGDTRFATPVRVEFHNGIMAAFYAPNGVPIYAQDQVVAAWNYSDVSNTATATAGEVDQEPGTPGYRAPGTEASQDPALRTTSTQNAATLTEITGTVLELPFAEVSWVLDRIQRLEQFPPGWHPGC